LGEIIDETDEGLKERYSTKDIEAEEFDWGNVEQTKKNISKIKTSKHRYKGYINGVR
jgi:hypothetical protein